MTKSEKYQKATVDHKYALARIAELEKEMTELRQKLQSTRQELKYATGQEKRPEPYDHHY